MTRPRTFLVLAVLLLSATPLFADSADLRITPWSDQGNRVAFSAYNFGPDVAKNVVLTVDVPGALSITGVYQGNGNCDATKRPVVCRVDSLGTFGVVLAFDFQLALPNIDATNIVRASVTSDTPDPDMTNNSASLTFVTQEVMQLYETIGPTVARVNPGEASTFTADIRNFADSNPHDIKVHFEAKGGLIESITNSEAIWDCRIADDKRSIDCAADALAEHCRCAGEMSVTVRSSDDRNGSEVRLTVRASGSLPQPYQGEPGTATLEAYRIIAVTNTADAGEGSLRNAIEIANEHCTPGPCKIVFEIPAPVPTEGWFTIIPETPLPAITAERVFIDGKWQKSITGDTMPNAPVIAIDMHRAHSGLTLASSCDGVLQGIAIGNADADQALRYFLNRPCSPKSYYFNPDRHFITESHFGADPAGNPWPNLRGIVADNGMGSITKSVISNNVRSGVWTYEGSWLTLSENRIERNGASGIFLGPRTEWSTVQWNVINDNAEMGVAVANTALEVDIRQNSMRNNGGLGIDWGLDGVSPNDGDDTNKPTNAPSLLSATYNPVSNQTLVTYRIHSTPLRSWGNGLTDFYVNDSPNGDGEKYIGAQTYPSEPGEVHSYAILGDLRGKWINATWTRVYFDFLHAPGEPKVSSNAYAGGHTWTSELSNSVLVR